MGDFGAIRGAVPSKPEAMCGRSGAGLKAAERKRNDGLMAYQGRFEGGSRVVWRPSADEVEEVWRAGREPFGGNRQTVWRRFGDGSRQLDGKVCVSFYYINVRNCASPLGRLGTAVHTARQMKRQRNWASLLARNRPPPES